VREKAVHSPVLKAALSRRGEGRNFGLGNWGGRMHQKENDKRGGPLQFFRVKMRGFHRTKKEGSKTGRRTFDRGRFLNAKGQKNLNTRIRIYREESLLRKGGDLEKEIKLKGKRGTPVKWELYTELIL